MLKRGQRTLPGWRDFECAVAAAFKGVTTENKSIYDVIWGDRYGLSCKMRQTLPVAEKSVMAFIPFLFGDLARESGIWASRQSGIVFP